MKFDKASLINIFNENLKLFADAMTSNILSKDEKVSPMAIGMVKAKNSYDIYKCQFSYDKETLEEMKDKVETMQDMLSTTIITRMNGHWNPKPVQLKVEKKIVILLNGKEL